MSEEPQPPAGPVGKISISLGARTVVNPPRRSALHEEEEHVEEPEYITAVSGNTIVRYGIAFSSVGLEIFYAALVYRKKLPNKCFSFHYQ
jgi:hypothetical protein